MVYWHELTKKEQDFLIANKITWEEFLATYQQPLWCGYPDALANLGCCSLTNGSVHCKEDCRGCELMR
jgi:hypothetical protein